LYNEVLKYKILSPLRKNYSAKYEVTRAVWAEESVLYQIYPLGLCGAPEENDGVMVNRIRRVEEWVPHLERLGVNAVLFNPLFESDRHGYDTRDYTKLDCRLGTNADFKAVCAKLHDAGMRVLLDGVFNHVGRGFWAFQDVLKQRERSPYLDWFYIRLDGDNGYHDGLWYEGWEGHYELVKLNLRNPGVKEHLFSCIRSWVEEFGVDGLRLDVAYCLDRDFLRELRGFCRSLKPDFFLFGEIMGGDYRSIVNPEMLDSCTNYECWKGLYSSYNDANFFEINYSLNRQFSDDPYAIYKGLSLVSFADNHDVTRLASMLREKRHLPLAYTLLFTMPGIPCLYYGSEWGIEGEKKEGDRALRPALEAPKENDLTAYLAKLIRLRKESAALRGGGYKTVHVANRQLAFLRERDGERMLTAINLDGAEAVIPLPGCGKAVELLTGTPCDLEGQCAMPPFTASVWRLQ